MNIEKQTVNLLSGKQLALAGKCIALADALKDAERFGTAVDEPEGARYVQISDTLALELSEFLRGLGEMVTRAVLKP